MYVVKRGLISSDVIHTVTSHYFQSAQSPPYSLSPLLPPHFLFLSFYVTPFPCYTFGTTHLHTPASCFSTLPPCFSASLKPFLSPHLDFILYCYHSPSYHLSSHQLFYLSAHWALLSPWWTFSILLFLPYGPRHTSKKNLRFISAKFHFISAKVQHCNNTELQWAPFPTSQAHSKWSTNQLERVSSFKSII